MSNVDPNDNLRRALISLDGLSVGDAFGECFFSIALDPTGYAHRLRNQDPPPHRWRYTDDTEMAQSIVEVLHRHGRIDQDELAERFARRYANDDRRGYGGMAHEILRRLGAGEHWSRVSPEVFHGQGSLGNGGAMRAAPIGAWFSDDLSAAVEHAELSAEVTHAHPEGQAGAIAIVVAAAFASTHRGQTSPRVRREMLDCVLDHTPPGATRDGIARAADLPRLEAVDVAVDQLGNGERVTAPDTVPLCLWLAARHFENYPAAMWQTVSASGDVDTNCAIVGGIVALSAAPQQGVPPAWLAAREPLKLHLSV